MQARTTNPLLQASVFPPFDRIQVDDIVPAIKSVLKQNRQEIAQLLQSPPSDWSLIERLEAIEDRLSQVWSPVSHMNAVVNSEALRQAYNDCLPLISEYRTELGQSEELFGAYQALAGSDGFSALEAGQQQLVRHALRDFQLSGVALSGDAKGRYAALRKRLAELGSQFSENVLDATQSWFRQFDDQQALAGLPDNVLALAAQTAKEKGLPGYVLTLDFPCYNGVMTYADNRSLREQVYRAYVTRASDQSDTSDAWNNGPLIDELLQLRHELAQLLGFENYAQYSLATKMAQTTDQVVDFLQDLADKSLLQARQEVQELAQFAMDTASLDELQAWDVGYFSEKLRQQRFDIGQEQLRPYFPLHRVLSGLFTVTQRLFSIHIKEIPAEGLWHADARLFELQCEGQVRGYFYLDLYARNHKRGGAWMDECRVRRRLPDGSIQLPVAYLVCNFNPPLTGQPALLTHSEVTTMFHEFGHGLHQMLTQQEWAGISGINGVPWDAVELPSQFLENWCWQTEALTLISGHHQTGESLPQALLDRMLAARHFQSGMMMVRQLEFALFDFLLHRDYRPVENATGANRASDPQALLDRVRGQVAVIQAPHYNRFQNSFSHVFSGGYAAGYYSYKWAEVLAADAFSRFEEEGVFNSETGHDFVESILCKGGSAEPMALFRSFRGRMPSVDALLRQQGLIPTDVEEHVSDDN